MSTISKALIALASVAFLAAVFVVFFRPVLGIQAESFSRASGNLALIAIALSVCSERGAKA